MLDLLAGVTEKIDLKRILPPKFPLRAEIDQIDELAQSISSVGLLHPIVVRIVQDHFEVVAGHRRLEACKRLRLTRVPCHVVEMDDRRAFEASLVENVQHESLDPIDEATAFATYTSTHKWGGISELARAIGRSETYVSKRIALLSFPKEIQEKIIRRRINISSAEELISLPVDSQVELSDYAEKNDLTKMEVRSIARRLRNDNIQRSEEDISQIRHYDDPAKNARKSVEKAIVSLRIAMFRLDDIINDMEPGLLRELLTEKRWIIHGQVDSLLRVKKSQRNLL
jgi:ParB family transcriptional regulator, chromosome partitioning protein